MTFTPKSCKWSLSFSSDTNN